MRFPFFFNKEKKTRQTNTSSLFCSFEDSLLLKYQVPNQINVQSDRIYYIPNKNVFLTLNETYLAILDPYTLKKKLSHPIPRLFLASQNICYLSDINIFIVTTRANMSSIFHLSNKLKLIGTAPVGLPFLEHVPKTNLMISYGKFEVITWNLYTGETYYQEGGSFHKVKYLKGINKVATFEGLFCELYIYDLTSQKGFTKKQKLYTNDNSFGSLNQIEWLDESKSLVVADSVEGKILIWSLSPQRKWNKIHTIEKDGIITQALKLSPEVFIFSWNINKQEESYIMETSSGNLKRLKKEIKKVLYCSSKTKEIISHSDNELLRYRF